MKREGTVTMKGAAETAATRGDTGKPNQVHKPTMLFPFAQPRKPQQSLINAIAGALASGRSIVANAPTGLGKTAASLAPSLPVTGKVIFLTSRHTQHAIAIKTLQLIQERHGVVLPAADIIGKRHFCLQDAAANMPPSEFPEYCKNMRESGRCKYYKASRGHDGTVAVGELSVVPSSFAQVTTSSARHGVCPYETAMELAKKARVIVADYNYLFQPRIRESFLARSNIALKDAVVIVDEAHNLPSRLREMASARLTAYMLSRAIKECRTHRKRDAAKALRELERQFLALQPRDGERLVQRDEVWLDEDAVEELIIAAEDIRLRQQRSSVHGIVEFLDKWLGADGSRVVPGQDGAETGFIRIARTEQGKQSLLYRCLDPSLFSGEVLQGCKGAIVMSGTLTPTEMYRDLLGLPKDTPCLAFPSPFPHENRLLLIVPKTTTRFAKRSVGQYADIAKEIDAVVAALPGNCAVFFPSYALRDAVAVHLQHRPLLREQAGMEKEDKDALLAKLVGSKHGVLLGVAAGSFSEGLDLPGVLSGVIVVGLPLQKPDLETQQLIAYYDKRYGRGFDYGYTFPALTKVIQSAGRCIRREHDKGVVVFLDERYSWSAYKSCFPTDWRMDASLHPGRAIKAFFDGHDHGKKA
ncbi:hypothetical protein AUJ68_04835 [Candidatus Woesearchaeota archaeon CG1_02_57_44]|nr:MAG: hypothetical protein AUJ68_04835 [Candidatus Woesearchaeota archaeon CG1_02_57_44]